MQPIHLRNLPPPDETFNHAEFISFIASYVKPERYLELGVRAGPTFLEVSKYCKESIAVDMAACPFQLSENMTYHRSTTDDYFYNLDQNVKFDMVFIDADHSHEQSLKDFLNVKDRVIEDGIILFHDTYPYDPSMFRPDKCNDVYKTAHYIKLNLNEEFESLTLPFNPGLTLVKKMARSKQLLYI